jgi:hypothetical protein
MFDQITMERLASHWDRFGTFVASGDFNGDGCGDLAVGAINDYKKDAPSAGEVNVAYGSRDYGLWQPPGSAVTFDQTTLGLSAETNDWFGGPLATGDFNADGYDDLVVGVPFEGVGDQEDAGGISVIYGGPNGLAATGSQWFDQGTLGLAVEAEDYFGAALAVGDFDGDGYDDLAASADGEDVGTPAAVADAGGFCIIFGSADGLSSAGRQWFDQATLGLTPEESDKFGDAMASGDFDGDGRHDLAVGAPGEGVAGVDDAGGVSVLYGSAAGLSVAGSQWFDQGVIGLDLGTGDHTGSSLAAGDIDGDGHDDLAIGVPNEDVGVPVEVEDAGEVNILYGGSAGLSVAGAQYFDQEVVGLTVEAMDRYGWSLTMGDMNLDGYADLAIGAPFESIDGFVEAGGVNVLYGDASGLSTLGQQWFDQSLPNLSGEPDTYEGFGYALTVVESPLIFADGFESATTGAWSN